MRTAGPFFWPLHLAVATEDGAMAGDPRQCRIYAVQCAELASSSITVHLKMTLLELSKNWEKLAFDLERTQALLAEDKKHLRKSA